MSALLSRRTTVCAAVSASFAAVSFAAPALAATHSGFAGAAYGSKARAGSNARSGETALVPMCTARTGVSRSDRSAAVHMKGVGTIGAVVTHVGSTRPKPGTVASVSSTRTGATTLAKVIHASALATHVRVSRSAHGYSHAASATLTGLTIAGHSMPANPPKNKRMSVPGVGTVVLNRETYADHNGIRSATVTALILTMAKNNSAGLPPGKVVVGSAAASLHRPVHHLAYGNAYGSSINGRNVASGRSAPAYLPCAGSDGHVTTNTSAGATKSGSLTSADVVSSAVSTDTKTQTAARTRSRISSARLFGGVIAGKDITAQARAVRRNGKLERSASGTTIGSLTVQGKKYSTSQPTKRTLSGIGTLYVHRVIKSRTGLQVYALELVLSKARGGLAKGTTIILGSAQAGVRK